MKLRYFMSQNEYNRAILDAYRDYKRSNSTSDIRILEDDAFNAGWDACINFLPKLFEAYTKENLHDADMPFSSDAEIIAGMRYFLQWLNSKQ